MTTETIYSKKNRIKPSFNISMHLMIYLGTLMKILSIIIMKHIYHQRIINMYLLDHNMIHQNIDFIVITSLFWIYYQIIQRVFNDRYKFFFPNKKKLSSHMDQISENINYSNNKNNSHDRTRTIIFNLGSKKYENNNNSTYQISSLYNLLLMIIFDTPEKDLPNVDQKSGMKKVHIYSVNSPTLFIALCVQCIIQ